MGFGFVCPVLSCFPCCDSPLLSDKWSDHAGKKGCFAIVGGGRRGVNLGSRMLWFASFWRKEVLALRSTGFKLHKAEAAIDCASKSF